MAKESSSCDMALGFDNNGRVDVVDALDDVVDVLVVVEVVVDVAGLFCRIATMASSGFN